MMNVYIKYLILLIYCSLSFIIPVLIFARGLLLYRDVLPNKSTCAIHGNDYLNLNNSNRRSDYFFHRANTPNTEQFCHPSNFKIILVIIDALRFDFVEYSNNLRSNSYYANKLTVIHDLLANHSKYAKLFKFIADPPTTTMQRILGLTTGSLPTFVDVRSNFASTEVEEDNLIDILRRHGKNVVFLGDDTWGKLYPNRFVRNFPFDSFNVWDLDTVDLGIEKHLKKEILKSDWHMIIAHFLGVDHCGHRYGPNHSEMERKLAEMNKVLKGIIDEIREKPDTLLFVIGDHGMTTTGDHGGDTENEISTALFAYSPVYEFYTNPRITKTVNQVDLASTLTTIIGVPIPFSNAGSIILETIPNILLDSCVKLSFMLWRNIEQITNYVKEYSFRNSQFKSTGKIYRVLERYLYLKDIWININESDINRFVEDYRTYMENVLQMFQEIWVQFDFVLIDVGLLVMFVILILSCSLVHKFTLPSIDQIITKKFQVISVSNIGILPLVIYFFCKGYSLNYELTSYFVMEFSFLSIISGLCWTLFKNSLFKPSISNQWYWKKYAFVYFIYGCSLAAIFSNSFILEEPAVMLFLVSTSLISLILSCRILGKRKLGVLCIEKKKILIYALAILLTFRISFNFIRCREESDRCYQTLMTGKFETKWQILDVVFLVGFIIWCLNTFVSSSILLVGSTVSGGLLCFRWICEIFFDQFYINEIPSVIFIVSGLSICYLFSKLKLSIDFEEVEPMRSCEIIFEYMLMFLTILGCTILERMYAIPSIFMAISLRMLALFLKEIEHDSWTKAIMWSMSSTFWFYATGHYASFAGIQWNAAFLLNKEIGNNMIVPGILVGLNTFWSYFVHAVMLPLLATCNNSSSRSLSKRPVWGEHIDISSYSNENEFLHSTFSLLLKYVIIFAIRTLFVMLSSRVLSRHLMMWKIFAPKFIFEAIAFVAVTVPASLLGFLLTSRTINIRFRTF